jgi:hypothetical protein
MDFLEDLFDLGDRKRRKHRDGDYDKHHERSHDDEYFEDDHHEHNDREHGYYENQQGRGTFCPCCSTQAQQGAKFCQNCGTTITVLSNCSGCGAKIATNASFCSECGKKLK